MGIVPEPLAFLGVSFSVVSGDTYRFKKHLYSLFFCGLFGDAQFFLLVRFLTCQVIHIVLK